MKAVFFTDSNIVLSWIRCQTREFKPFVSARVEEIQSNSDRSQWRHMPGEFNVADEVSRGTPVNWQMETRTRVSWLARGWLAKWRIYCRLVWSWERTTQAPSRHEARQPARVDWLQKIFKLEKTCEIKRLRLEVRLESTYAIEKEQDSRKFQRSKQRTSHTSRTSGCRDLVGERESERPPWSSQE